MGNIGANDSLWTEATLGHQESGYQAATADQVQATRVPTSAPPLRRLVGFFVVWVTFLVPDQRYDRGDDQTNADQWR